MGPINGWGVCSVVMVIVICLASGRYGAIRRRAGRPVTGRETVTIALIAGALAFLTVSLPAVFNRNGGVTAFEVLERLAAVIAIGFAPLAVWLLIRVLTRFAVNVQKPGPTDPMQPERHSAHPLD